MSARRWPAFLDLPSFAPNDSPNAEIIPMLKKAAEELEQVIIDITKLTDDLI